MSESYGLDLYNNYDNNDYDNNDYDNNDNKNHAIQQGKNFTKYSNQYVNAKENSFPLLTESSSSGVDSIIEGLEPIYDSSHLRGTTVIQQKLSRKEAQFNKLLSEYTTLYTTFNTSLLKRKPSSNDLAQRRIIKQNLNKKYLELRALANYIKQNINQLKIENSKNQNNIDRSYTTILSKINNLNNVKNQLSRVSLNDTVSIDAKLETSSLNTTSIEVHYIVYFLIVITLMAFIVNIMINPNANTMNAAVVVTALITVYIITRWVIPT